MLCLIVAAAITIGVLAAYAVNVRGMDSVRDPTYEEALEFVRSDSTDRNRYNQTYTCFDFARDFVHNALKEGYRCAQITIEFSDAKHVIVAFNTSDEGLVFIEPQNDDFVTLAVGQTYLGRTVVGFSVDWVAPYELASVLLLSMLFLPSFTMMSLLTIAALRGEETETDGVARDQPSSNVER